MIWPRFEEDEIEAATRVLRSGRVNYWTGGEGRAFEAELATYLGVGHGIALANGTVAIELALWALGIDAGEVVVPARTFVATAHAVRMRGATPVFADVDRDHGGMSASTLEARLSPRTRAVIVVHLGGWPCDIEEIAALCRERGLPLVEDCAQAHGAAVRGRKVGSFGTAAAFSFCQDKILTTAGEGGMLVTDDEALWKQAWSLKDHGKDWDEVHRDDHPPGFRWLHQRLGTNWRLSELQSAVGRVQLGKLDRWLRHRRQLAALLDERLGAVPGLRVPRPPAGVEPAYYKHYAYVDPTALAAGWSRDRIMAEVGARGCYCASGSCSEIYLEAAFPEAMRPHPRLPVAKELGETSLMFRVDPTVSEAEIERTGEVVAAVMAEATA
ncbi:MAG: DegT/DnrJ/EryC1/StrS aminotransferase family protein [Myxococcales bacterium]|nr:DegT/DnrJ/EryC1/StrS aminotransferase family protein [Myxococcales bacterium]MCB9713336.1 DegT/DnrJ/EryC1/StrS aminotransferase family protein [Myxococcales bacterium]